QVIANVLGKSIIQWPSFFFENARSYLHSGLSQLRKASSADHGIRVSHTRHHALNSCRNQCICTRPGAAVMATRLEVYIKRRTPRLLPGLLYSQNFGVLLSPVGVETLAQNFAVRVRQYCANIGIR